MPNQTSSSLYATQLTASTAGLNVSEAVHSGLHVREAVHVSKSDKILFFISNLNYFVAFQLSSDFSSFCISATLDLPMVVDLIGIFESNGPYCTLTMTDWFCKHYQ
ncbi:hypothetical protein F511_45288 [Dorcoceras hygrometricum]|uniref:Uncharacterized protein n=1 Tax=Dorcoceras hygrometricum TaxID=472368 RepID=A0A2Z6ZW92_9LAMI|nr:hypothetical protein F511_45288 [Dorcoceras hygrometricum]